MTSKFDNIKFPLYGTRHLPYDIRYQGPKKLIKYTENHGYTLLDDTSIPYYSYFERLLYMTIHKIKRFEFHYTILNMNQLFHTKINWGIDNLGQEYRLAKKEYFPYRCAKIERIYNKYVWVNGISYPFILPNGLEKDEQIKEKYLELIRVKYKWYLYNISPEFIVKDYKKI